MPGLAAFVVGEVQRAYGGDAYEHQDGGEQGEDNQWSLLVDVQCRKQLHRQALTGLIISDLRLEGRDRSYETRTLADTNFLHPMYWY